MIFSVADILTQKKVIAEEGTVTGCVSNGNRQITMFFFPLKEPNHCIWHNGDALINYPYHIFLSFLLVLLYQKFRKKK
jgi:hypothetical protein